jgi:hypothetical protein
LDDKTLIGENMTFGSIAIPAGQDVRMFLADLEAKLADAKARRDGILADLQKVSAAIDAGDKKARGTQGELNKQDVAQGRLLKSLEMQIAEARRHVALAQAQADAVALKRAQSDAAAVPHDKMFEVIAPDGRKVRHRHSSPEALQRVLTPGYVVVAEVFGADNDDKGGFAASIGSKSNMMEGLLQAHGDTLLAWLAANGIIADKTVVVLPANGREMQ